MVRFIENGYVCEHCGRSIMDDDLEVEYFPFCSEKCEEDFYGCSIEEMDEFNE